MNIGVLTWAGAAYAAGNMVVMRYEAARLERIDQSAVLKTLASSVNNLSSGWEAALCSRTGRRGKGSR